MKTQGVGRDVARAVFTALLIEAVKVLATHYGKKFFPEGEQPAPETWKRTSRRRRSKR